MDGCFLRDHLSHKSNRSTFSDSGGLFGVNCWSAQRTHGVRFLHFYHLLLDRHGAMGPVYYKSSSLQ